MNRPYGGTGVCIVGAGLAPPACSSRAGVREGQAPPLRGMWVCTAGVGALDDPFYSLAAVRTKLSGIPFSVVLIVAGDYQFPIGSIK